MARRIESFFIAGPAGRLEAMLEEPDNVRLSKRRSCVIRIHKAEARCITR